MRKEERKIKREKNSINRRFSIKNIEEYSNNVVGDMRFTKVRITLLHTGENLNGSIFTKEAIEKALPTLKNVPILGYIKYNEDVSQDFREHEWEITLKAGEIEEKYIGSAYGVIPESNNAKFEKITDKDGVEREYLIVDGLMWNRFDDAVNILNRDIFKSQSMEISENYKGYWNDDGYFVFTDFQFDGACILGDDYPPAMIGANITTNFSNINKEITSYINSNLNKYFLKDKGVKTVGEKSNKNTDDLIQEYSNRIKELEEQLNEYSQKENSDKIADLEEKINEYSTKLEEKENRIVELENENKGLANTIEENNSTIENLKSQIQEIEFAKKEEIINEYSTKLEGIEEYETFKKDSDAIKTFSINEVQNNLNRILGENICNGNIKKFSLDKKKNKEENEFVPIYFAEDNQKIETSRYGDFI